MVAPVEYSVVVPVYNEQQTLPELLSRLGAVMRPLGDYELIFVDDGSTDGTLEILRRSVSSDPRVRVLSFSRNFGHQTAITAGLHRAGGRAVVVMDGDLQDPPEVIPEMARKWKEGFEVVYAVRRTRKGNPLKRAAYAVFYRLLARLSDIKIPLDAGDFGLMDRRVVDQINAMPERTRFVRGLRSWVGFRQAPVVYDRQERFAGRPKYTLRKLVKLGLDGMFSFSAVPLRAATALGFVVSILALLYILKILYWYFFYPPEEVARLKGWATTVTAILFLGGVQLIAIGVLGEYMGRIYEEVKQRPHYIFKEEIGFDGPEGKSRAE